MRSSRWKIGLVVGLFLLAVGFGSYRAINSYSDEIVNALYPDSKPPKNNLMDMYDVKFDPTYSCQDFQSSADAYRAFETHYKSAGLWCYNSKLLRREPKVDATGHQVGTRVTAIIGCGVEGQQYAVIWWTNGARFCRIEAPQMYQAENVERANTR